MIKLNETHDPALVSWVPSANQANCEFPIQNLPFASFTVTGSDELYRGGVAIGNQIVDLNALSRTGLLDGAAQAACEAASQSTLNDFMRMGREASAALRLQLSRLLRKGTYAEPVVAECLVPQETAQYQTPCQIGDYTDFYTSVFHATNVGKQFRPDNPLLPNYKWIPIGYHGRSSSIDVSGQTFHRPYGQLKAPDSDTPCLGPSQRLDLELEMGIFIGAENTFGKAISIDSAEQHVFGLCLFNDWSARDIQAWEYQPLGPFLAKNFASTVSPWVITMEALAPFRTSFERSQDDPQPLPYLSSESNNQHGGVDINIDVLILTEKMRQEGLPPQRISSSNFKHSYWTVAQMVAHHTVNGCNLRAGDLFGSGTQSGPNPEEAGSLLELTAGGKQPLKLDNGESRTFLEDGDTIILRGNCQREGAVSIGFGEVSGTVLPAHPAQ
ncbi:fumarylacetoacetase [Alteromonas gilva]|uniref:fumarylacetoacetase n=1 Tax=Alteromonas gilva TaxID=2987522 RepID=A0ABT5KZR4_9ALTE|nr:fumarylacetoacetase [Alteromonas gilva]MDC8830262.1 fumarylacetoacetase [Alteromonas gilva]